MFRPILATLILTLAGLLATASAAAHPRSERGIVLERTHQSLLVQHPDGDRQRYRRNRHTELRALESWRSLERGDRVELRYHGLRRGRRLLQRVNRTSWRREHDGLRQDTYDRRFGSAYQRGRPMQRHLWTASLRGHVVHVGRGRLVLETDVGDRLRLLVSHETRLHGIHRLRDLHDFDRLEVTFQPGHDGDPVAASVTYLGRESRPPS